MRADPAVPVRRVQKQFFANIRWGEFAALYGVALVAGLIGNLIVCIGYDQCYPGLMENWKLHQFLFSYGDLGFARRALLGTLLGLPNDLDTGAPFIRLFGLAVFLVFTAIVLVLSFSAHRSIRILLVLSPAVFMQAGHDFGRLDHVNYILMFAILLSGLEWAVLLAPVLVLVHEGSFLIQLPILFALHAMLHGRLRATLSAAAISIAAFAAVMTVGRLDPSFDLQALYPRMPEQVGVLSRGTVENIDYVFRQFSKFGLTYVLTAALLAAYLVLLFAKLRKYLPKERLLGVPLMLAAFTPALVSIVAIDWPRFWSYVALNLFLMVFWRLAIRKAQGKAPEADDGYDLSWRVLASAAVLGPFGIVEPVTLLHYFKYRLLG